MACKQLLNGHDISCLEVKRKYYQQIVLVNIDDLDEIAYDVNDANHSIVFNLVEGATGFLYRGNENVSLYSASFSKLVKKGQPLYSHSVSMPVIGVTVNTKLVLKELDSGSYFAAIQFTDGTIEIYGIEHGLTSTNYTFDAQNGLGGISISLTSRFEEEDPPYVYAGGESNFDNLFVDIPALLGGDFSNDFSDDFYIIQL